MSSGPVEPPGQAAEGSHIPADTLTAAEFRIAREDLGLTSDWLAQHWGLSGDRVIRKWEAGTSTVPPARADQLGALTDEADRQIEALVTRLLDEPEPVLVIPQGEHDGYPGGWWRRIAARVIEDVPGLRVTYAD